MFTPGFLELSRDNRADETSPSTAEGVFGTNPDTQPGTKEYNEFKTIYRSYFPTLARCAAVHREHVRRGDPHRARDPAGRHGDRPRGDSRCAPQGRDRPGQAVHAGAGRRRAARAPAGQDIDYKGASGNVDFEANGNVKSGFIVWEAFRDPKTKKVDYRTVARSRPKSSWTKSSERAMMRPMKLARGAAAAVFALSIVACTAASKRTVDRHLHASRSRRRRRPWRRTTVQLLVFEVPKATDERNDFCLTLIQGAKASGPAEADPREHPREHLRDARRAKADHHPLRREGRARGREAQDERLSHRLHDRDVRRRRRAARHRSSRSSTSASPCPTPRARPSATSAHQKCPAL